MNDAPIYPPRRAPGRPQTAFITACEALTWIAWGEARTVESINENAFASVRRWGTSELGLVLDAIEARAASEPFCAIKSRYALEQQMKNFPYEERYTTIFSSQEGPRALRAIRARARQRTGHLISFPQLAKQLRAEIEDNQRRSVLVERSTAELLEAIRAEKITAFGQRRFPNGDRNPGAPHDPVPIEAVIHPSVTIELWNQLAIDSEADITAWNARRGMAFDDVRFKTADVLRLWPVQSIAAETASADKAATLPPPVGGASVARRTPQRTDSCTLTDAVGRIAYRDEYNGRYYAAPGDAGAEGESRHRRKLDKLYPTNSGLPGISDFAGLRNTEFGTALTAWELADDKRWGDAEHTLLDVLLAGTIKAFDETGNAVPAEFWLANTLLSLRARGFRLRAGDLVAIGLVPSARAVSLNPVGGTTAAHCGLPEELARDPRVVAAFDEMRRFAEECIMSRGGPPKRDDAAKAVNKKTTYPVREARKLYRFLPDRLRNPARTPRS